ncbi:MAG: ABC-F family ATP-binding cassette domain-containing protein, partial [Oscillospiraceae bacterium]|nr:ABC-F family ATP-binding cassette domain-containing protein [Oscillospiraceae bacterium]
TVNDVSVTVDGVKLLDKVYFSVGKNDKIAFVGENELAQTALFKVLMGELEPDEGSVKWGISTIRSYLPKDNTEYFEGNDTELVDWLRQYSAKKDDVYLRGFLGRMLFSNEDVFKKVNVLSGGEKVRCMLSKMMLSGANVVLLDQPTNHLDMESIQAVNKGLEAFTGVVLLASHDHEMLTSTCNRVIAFQPDGTIIDRYGTYDDYLEWMAQQKEP